MTTNLTRWFDRTSDPNSPVALAGRAEQLRAARREPVADRIAYLSQLARGRRVLDIGAADHDASSSERARWLHRELANVASYCLGIDILPEAVETLASEGYNVRTCDITRETVEGTFDLVIAGEVIEHVGRPGDMFENVAALLDRDGRFVLSTPNPFALHRVWRGCRGDAADSVDHIAYYAPSNVLELAERSGLALDSYRGVRLKRMRSARGRIHAALRSVLGSTLFTEDVGCETIVYECVKPGLDR